MKITRTSKFRCRYQIFKYYSSLYHHPHPLVNISANCSLLYCLYYILNWNKIKEKMWRWIYSISITAISSETIKYMHIWVYCSYTCVYVCPKVLWHDVYTCISSSYFKKRWFTIYMFTVEIFEERTAVRMS